MYIPKKIKDISLIINEISQIGFFSHLNQLNTFAKIFELCSENEITLIFSNTEFLFKKFLLSFSQYDEIKSKEISIFFSLLLHLSSFSEIIPNLVNMNIGEFLNSYLCKSPVEFQSKSLDIILNLFCHSSKTIKFLLHSLKNTIFNLMIYISVEEIMRKSLQSICICFICGDDEICFELLNKEIFGLILTSLDHWDIDHLILLMKTIEKILFYGQEIRNNTDEQNVFFELFCILKGEEQLEKMTMHPSKTISLMALHIIDKYF